MLEKARHNCDTRKYEKYIIKKDNKIKECVDWENQRGSMI
jgi:hypothetical protein